MRGKSGEAIALSADERLDAIRAVPGAVSRIFVAPEQRIMYVSLNKNACTSIKWMIAGIVGEDLDSFTPGLLPVTGQADAIQNRTAWAHAPRLTELDRQVRESIHPDNGWFVFAVVRDPRNRLFSAWQNKLLLENPGYTHYRAKDWYPRHPLSTESIVEDFEKFVTLLENEPDHRLRTVDPHFRDQAELLMPDLVDYSRIYEIGELSDLLNDIRAHLDSVGWSGHVHLPRSNDTPLRVNAAPFANGVRERVEKVFGADFELFPDRWDFAKAEAAAPWTDAELREAELHAAYGRRIGDLRNTAIRYRDDAKRAKERAHREKERADNAAPATRARTAAQQLLGRLRGLAARFRR